MSQTLPVSLRITFAITFLLFFLADTLRYSFQIRECSLQSELPSMAPGYTFEDLTDFIGLPVSSWPTSIYATYQKAMYKAEDRFKLCLFNFVNGFDNRIFLEYAIAKGALCDKAAIQDVKRISAVLEQRLLHMHEWFSFCLAENRWVYLDGSTKYY